MGVVVKPRPVRFDTKRQILTRGQKQNRSSKIRRLFSWLLSPSDKCKHCREYGGVWILEEDNGFVIDIYVHCEKCNKTHTSVRIIPLKF
jgi:excinuclease UvrABC ATPase subunit